MRRRDILRGGCTTCGVVRPRSKRITRSGLTFEWVVGQASEASGRGFRLLTAFQLNLLTPHSDHPVTETPRRLCCSNLRLLFEASLICYISRRIPPVPWRYKGGLPPYAKAVVIIMSDAPKTVPPMSSVKLRDVPKDSHFETLQLHAGCVCPLPMCYNTAVTEKATRVANGWTHTPMPERYQSMHLQ